MAVACAKSNGIVVSRDAPAEREPGPCKVLALRSEYVASRLTKFVKLDRAKYTSQGVKRARQDRFAAEAFFEEARQELLDLEELCAKGAELLVHGGSRGEGGAVL